MRLCYFFGLPSCDALDAVVRCDGRALSTSERLALLPRLVPAVTFVRAVVRVGACACCSAAEMAACRSFWCRRATSSASSASGSSALTSGAFFFDTDAPDEARR